MGQRGADWLVVWLGAPAAVPSSARVSEEMSEERGEPPSGARDQTSPWESDPQLPIGTFPAQVRAAASAPDSASPACLAGWPSHMAGTRQGLARGADRRTRRPVGGRGWGDGVACGGRVTVGHRSLGLWGRGVRAEGMVPSGQRSRALPRDLSGSPMSSFPTHLPTPARAPTPAPRASMSGTPSGTATLLPRTTPRKRTITRHELTPLRAHPHCSHV